jgi:hypothetical protein
VAETSFLQPQLQLTSGHTHNRHDSGLVLTAYTWKCVAAYRLSRNRREGPAISDVDDVVGAGHGCIRKLIQNVDSKMDTKPVNNRYHNRRVESGILPLNYPRHLYVTMVVFAKEGGPDTKNSFQLMADKP